MLRLLLPLVLCVGLPFQARADESDQRSKRAFERGVAAAVASQWEQAAEAFEESLQARERPAARYNLVHAYAELKRPFDVARHALAFLRLPQDPARAEARDNVLRALESAARELCVLTTDSLPASAELFIDGAPALVLAAERRVFASPGLHKLEARLLDAPPQITQLYLNAGGRIAWPYVPPDAGLTSDTRERFDRAGGAEPLAASPTRHALEDHVRSSPVRAPLHTPARTLDAVPAAGLWRTRLGWTTGTLGVVSAAAALASYAFALRGAERLRERDPYGEGFLTHADRYLRLQASVAPLSIAAGVLSASAIAVRRPARSPARALAWSGMLVGSALIVSGVSVLSLSADRLGASRVSEPSQQLGAMLLSAALPLAVLGVSALWHGRRSDRLLGGSSLGSARVRGR